MKNNNSYETLEECQLCHDSFSIFDIILTEDGYFYCKKCLIAEPSVRDEIS